MTGREVLLVPHTGRKSNLESSALAAELLDAAGIGVRVLAPENTPALANHPTLSRFSRFPHSKASADHVELVLVLGACWFPGGVGKRLARRGDTPGY